MNYSLRKKNLLLFGSLLLAALVLAALPVKTFAAMSPDLKECVQRGYKTITGYHLIEQLKVESGKHTSEEISGIKFSDTFCVFPTGERCLLDDFRRGVCGKNFKIESYCVEDGVLVWDDDMCCEDTQAYLSPGVTGQRHCVKINFFQKTVNQLLYPPVFISSLFFLVLLSIVVYFLKKKTTKDSSDR